MIWRRRPQILPTRKARGMVEAFLRFLERVPLFREAMRPQQEVAESDVELTLVIPLHRKDLWIAPYALKYARRHLRHPIAEIAVVSAPDPGIETWVEKEGLRWIDERDLLPYTREEVAQRLPDCAKGEAGWVFQQLLKFAVDREVDTEAFLILDADTLLLAPRVFKVNDTVWQDYSHERNLLYLKGYRELLGRRAGFLVSFVCHHMFCEKHILKALKDRIEEQTGKRWDEAIIALAHSPVWTESERNTRPFNYFSEYETYGNFFRQFYGDVRTRYFRNHAAKEYSPAEMTPEEYVESLPSFFKWASFHSYYGYASTEEPVSTEEPGNQ